MKHNPSVNRGAAPFTFKLTHAHTSIFFLGYLLIGVSTVHGKECPPPPVTSKPQAVCIAKRFIEKPNPPQWQVGYEVKEEADHWSVHYYPTSPGVRGGAGDLKVYKAFGTVDVVSVSR
jgi:hypothetical protein